MSAVYEYIMRVGVQGMQDAQTLNSVLGQASAATARLATETRAASAAEAKASAAIREETGDLKRLIGVQRDAESNLERMTRAQLASTRAVREMRDEFRQLTTSMERVGHEMTQLANKQGRLRSGGHSGGIGRGRGRMGSSGGFDGENIGREIAEDMVLAGPLGGVGRYAMAGMGGMSAGAVAATGGAAALVGGLAIGGRNMMRVERSVAEANATLRLSPEERAAFQSQIVGLAERENVDARDLARATADIVSLTGEKDRSLEIARLAARGARAGFTDAGVLGGGMAMISQSSGMAPKAVMDMMFAAQNAGGGSFDDFARYLPSLSGSARGAGFSMPDVAGLFSSLTRVVRPEQAMVGTTNLLSATTRAESRAKMEAMGINFYNEDGSRKGLESVLNQIQFGYQSLEDPQEQDRYLTEVGFTDTQAREAMANLIGSSDGAAEAFDKVRDSAGAAAAAQESSANAISKWEVAGNQWSNLLTKSADKLKLAEGAGAVAEGLTELGKQFLGAWKGFSQLHSLVRQEFGFGPNGQVSVNSTTAASAVPSVPTPLLNALSDKEKKAQKKKQDETMAKNKLDKDEAQEKEKNRYRTVLDTRDRSFYITIKKFQDKVEINTGSTTESAAELEQVVNTAMLKAINMAQAQVAN